MWTLCPRIFFPVFLSRGDMGEFGLGSDADDLNDPRDDENELLEVTWSDLNDPLGDVKEPLDAFDVTDEDPSRWIFSGTDSRVSMAVRPEPHGDCDKRRRSRTTSETRCKKESCERLQHYEWKYQCNSQLTSTLPRLSTMPRTFSFEKPMLEP